MAWGNFTTPLQALKSGASVPLTKPPPGAPPAAPAPAGAPPAAASSSRPSYASSAGSVSSIPLSSRGAARLSAMNRVLGSPTNTGKPAASASPARGDFLTRVSRAFTAPTAAPSVTPTVGAAGAPSAARDMGRRDTGAPVNNVLPFAPPASSDGGGGGGGGGGGWNGPGYGQQSSDPAAWNDDDGSTEGDGSPSDTYEADGEEGEGAYVPPDEGEAGDEAGAGGGLTVLVPKPATGIFAWLAWIFGDGPKPGTRVVVQRAAGRASRRAVEVATAPVGLDRYSSEEGDDTMDASGYMNALNGLGDGSLSDFFKSTGTDAAKAGAVAVLTDLNKRLGGSGAKQVAVPAAPPMSLAKKIAIGVVIGIPVIYLVTSMRKRGGASASSVVSNPRRRRRRHSRR